MWFQSFKSPRFLVRISALAHWDLLVSQRNKP
jgi:hypothetical protein